MNFTGMFYLDFGLTFLPFHKPGCLFRYPLCAQCPSRAPHQGIWGWVKPGPGLGETVFRFLPKRGGRGIVIIQAAG